MMVHGQTGVGIITYRLKNDTYIHYACGAVNEGHQFRRELWENFYKVVYALIHKLEEKFGALAENNNTNKTIDFILNSLK